jgi:hypothetical protein
MMMHEDWGTTQNYVVDDACRKIDLPRLPVREMRVGWEGFARREADFSAKLLTIRL